MKQFYFHYLLFAWIGFAALFVTGCSQAGKSSAQPDVAFYEQAFVGIEVVTDLERALIFQGDRISVHVVLRNCSGVPVLLKRLYSSGAFDGDVSYVASREGVLEFDSVENQFVHQSRVSANSSHYFSTPKRFHHGLLLPGEECEAVVQLKIHEGPAVDVVFSVDYYVAANYEALFSNLYLPRPGETVSLYRTVNWDEDPETRDPEIDAFLRQPPLQRVCIVALPAPFVELRQTVVRSLSVKPLKLPLSEARSRAGVDQGPYYYCVSLSAWVLADGETCWIVSEEESFTVDGDIACFDLIDLSEREIPLRFENLGVFQRQTVTQGAYYEGYDSERPARLPVSQLELLLKESRLHNWRLAVKNLRGAPCVYIANME